MNSQTPAIVLAAFGASSADARHVYEHIDELVRRCKPNHELTWAYTSPRIIEKLRRQKVPASTLGQAMDGLRERGACAAIVQPLLTVPGEEFVGINSTDSQGLHRVVGAPLLASRRDVVAAVDAIEPDFVPNAANVVVCHGNARHPEYNRPLRELAREIESRRPNVIVASIEGEPGTAPLERARTTARRCGAVHFIPFMMVAGEHIGRDVMGEEPDSWKSRIGAATTTCAPSLGWNFNILVILLRHLNAALAELHRGIQ